MKAKQAKLVNGTLVNTPSRSKKVQVVKRSAKATPKAAKSKKAPKVPEFKTYTQGYRAWKTLDKGSYQGQGQGTIANLRGDIGLKLIDTRATGQNVFLHVGDQGYGFTWGKQIDPVTMQCGNVQVRFPAKAIVATFKTFADFVKHVARKGEKNVLGVAEFKALSNGGRYVLYTNGRSVLRHEGAGTASGHYHDYQATGKHHAKFAMGVK